MMFPGPFIFWLCLISVFSKQNSHFYVEKDHLSMAFFNGRAGRIAASVTQALSEAERQTLEEMQQPVTPVHRTLGGRNPHEKTDGEIERECFKIWSKRGGFPIKWESKWELYKQKDRSLSVYPSKKQWVCSQHGPAIWSCQNVKYQGSRRPMICQWLA